MALYDAHERLISPQSRAQTSWTQRFKALVARYLGPGPARLLGGIGLAKLLLDWKATVEEAVTTGHQLSGLLGLFLPAIISPWFGVSLVLASVLYATFVPGETATPSSGVKVAHGVAWTACILSGLAVWTMLVLASTPGLRHLTQKQQMALERALGAGTDMSSRLWIVSYPECFDCRAYAWEFATTLNGISQFQNHKVGVLPYSDSMGGQLSTLWRGIIIGAPDPKHLTGDQLALTKALDTAHLKYSFQSIRLTVEHEGKRSDATVLLIAPQEG